MFKRNYGTQQSLEDGRFAIISDDTKYTPSDTLYNKPNVHKYSKLFESQFFNTIKTPEQAKVVQQTVANDGR